MWDYVCCSALPSQKVQGGQVTDGSDSSGLLFPPCQGCVWLTREAELGGHRQEVTVPPYSTQLQWVWKVTEDVNGKENSIFTVNIILYWNNLVDFRYYRFL